MSDVFLLEMSQEDFLKEVGKAFGLYRECRREGNLLPLAQSAFSESSLVEACLLAGEPLSVDARARGMDGLLHWVVDKLRPQGTPCLVTPAWRSYNMLFYPYLHPGVTNGERDKWTFPRLAEAMALSEQAIYKARRRALKAAGAILDEELKAPQDVAGRQRYLIERRYKSHHDDERLLFRLLSLLREPIPLSWGHELAKMWQVDDPPACFRGLLKGGLLVANDETIAVHAQARAYLATLLSSEERQALHETVGEYYEQSRSYFEAVYHLRQVPEYERAASILLEHYQSIVDNPQVEGLREQLALFEQAEVGDLTWARLKIAAGDVAFLVEDVDTALAEYGQALGTSDIPTKALASYRRGKAFELNNLDECLMHYNLGIKLLEELAPEEPLLGDIYIAKAWLYFQEKQELNKAKINFKRAEEVIDTDDKQRLANLHNAWARLSYHLADEEEELKHRLQAWLAATETQDRQLMIKSAHNLGVAYMWSKEQYQQGLVYLQKGLALVQEVGDRLKEGMFNKTIGACYFFLGQYQEAIDHYQKAYNICLETGNRNWQGTVCHDLAEVYAKMGKQTQMKRYFAEASAIAQKLGEKDLLQALAQLAYHYPGLAPPQVKLNERQLLVFEHVKKHGKITNKEYRELVNVSARTAARDLDEMVAKGVLKREGKARGTHYKLNS